MLCPIRPVEADVAEGRGARPVERSRNCTLSSICVSSNGSAISWKIRHRGGPRRSAACSPPRLLRAGHDVDDGKGIGRPDAAGPPRRETTTTPGPHGDIGPKVPSLTGVRGDDAVAADTACCTDCVAETAEAEEPVPGVISSTRVANDPRSAGARRARPRPTDERILGQPLRLGDAPLSGPSARQARPRATGTGSSLGRNRPDAAPEPPRNPRARAARKSRPAGTRRCARGIQPIAVVTRRLGLSIASTPPGPEHSMRLEQERRDLLGPEVLDHLPSEDQVHVSVVHG